MTKVERHAPLVVGLLIALPSVLARYLPMTDLPMHEGVVGLLRHFGDESYMPRGLYELNFGHPNQLFYILAWGLSFVFSTSMAVRLVVAFSQVLIFVAGARLADHLGRRRWGALLLTPLALGFTYYWGLVANLLGYGVLLAVLPTLDRTAKTPTWRNAGVSLMMLVLLYFAHESVFVAAALMLGLFVALRPVSIRSVVGLTPSMGAAAIAIGHQIWANKFYMSKQPMPTTYLSAWSKVRLLTNVLFGSHELFERTLLFGLALVPILIFAYARWKDAPAALCDTGWRRVRERLDTYRFEVVALLCFIAYFMVPFTWRGATLIHERFFALGWLVFAVVVAPRGDVPRLSTVLAPMLPVGVLLISWPQFHDASTSYSNLDEIIAHIPKNASVTHTVFDRVVFRTRVYSASTAPARIAAERGGRVGLSLTFSPISPVQIRPEYRWDEYNYRIIYLGSKMLQPAHDLTRFEWLVGESRDPAVREALVIALAPDADHIVTKGEWLLFHSKYPVVSPLSKETRPPHGLDTTADRVKRLISGAVESDTHQETP